MQPKCNIKMKVKPIEGLKILLSSLFKKINFTFHFKTFVYQMNILLEGFVFSGQKKR